MIAPLPKERSIWLIAASRAFVLSTVTSSTSCSCGFPISFDPLCDFGTALNAFLVTRRGKHSAVGFMSDGTERALFDAKPTVCSRLVGRKTYQMAVIGYEQKPYVLRMFQDQEKRTVQEHFFRQRFT